MSLKQDLKDSSDVQALVSILESISDLDDVSASMGFKQSSKLAAKNIKDFTQTGRADDIARFVKVTPSVQYEFDELKLDNEEGILRAVREVLADFGLPALPDRDPDAQLNRLVTDLGDDQLRDIIALQQQFGKQVMRSAGGSINMFGGGANQAVAQKALKEMDLLQDVKTGNLSLDSAQPKDNRTIELFSELKRTVTLRT